MKRIASRGIALSTVAILTMSGQAAAFTPVPIPKPRAGAAVAHVVLDQAHGITRPEARTPAAAGG